MPLKFFTPVLLFLAVLLAGCQSKTTSYGDSGLQAADEKTPVIAEIAGKPQYKAAFERYLKSHLSDLYQQQSSADNDLQRTSLLDEFIGRQVVLQEARAKGIKNTDDELMREFSNQHQQTNVEGNDKSQTALISTERKAETGDDMLIWKFYKAEVLKDVTTTPQEIEQYFKNNPKRYPQQPSFCVREIKVDDSADAEQLRKQVLDKPGDFATLAKEHSQSPSKGELICYTQGVLPEVLENAAMPLKTGGISTVVKSNFGYHIFQMVKKSDPLPFDKISKRVEEDLLRTKNQSRIDSYLEEAVAKAKIKVYPDKLGFNYTGRWKN